MTLKTTWKKERLEGLLKQHAQALQESNNTRNQPVREEITTPVEPQQSSERLRVKLVERARGTQLKANDQNILGVRSEKVSLEQSKDIRDKVLEPVKSNPKIIDFGSVKPSRRLVSKGDELNSTEQTFASTSGDTNLFSRTRIPRQYDQRLEGIIKKSNEVVRLDFRDTRPGRKMSLRKTEMSKDSDFGRSESQSRDNGSLGSTSIQLIKNRILQKRQTVTSNTLIRDFSDIKARKSSFDVETRLNSHGPSQTNSTNTIPTIKSLNDKAFKSFMNVKPTKISPQSNGALVTSLDRIDKATLTMLETTSRNILSRAGMTFTGSFNRLDEEPMMTKADLISPIHIKPKTRTSLRILKANTAKRESWKIASELAQSRDDSNLGHASFRVLGEKPKTTASATKIDTLSLKNMKHTPIYSLSGQS